MLAIAFFLLALALLQIRAPYSDLSNLANLDAVAVYVGFAIIGLFMALPALPYFDMGLTMLLVRGGGVIAFATMISAYQSAIAYLPYGEPRAFSTLLILSAIAIMFGWLLLFLKYVAEWFGSMRHRDNAVQGK